MLHKIDDDEKMKKTIAQHYKCIHWASQILDTTKQQYTIFLIYNRL